MAKVTAPLNLNYYAAYPLRCASSCNSTELCFLLRLLIVFFCFYSPGKLHTSRCDVQLEVLGWGRTPRRDVVESDVPDSWMYVARWQDVPSLCLPALRVVGRRCPSLAATRRLHRRYLHN